MPHVQLPQTEFKVVILGDTNVGKTSLVLRFTEGYYRENSRSPTVGAFFLTKRVQTSSGITAKVQIWDTAGQSQFRQMAPIYWRNSAAILVCYDVSNVQSWECAVEWVKELRRDRNVCEKNIVLALVATKSDLLDVADATDATDATNRAVDEHNHGGEQKSIVSMAKVEQVLQQLNHHQGSQLFMNSPINTTTTTTINTATITPTKASRGLSSSSSPSFLSSSQQYQQSQSNYSSSSSSPMHHQHHHQQQLHYPTQQLNNYNDNHSSNTYLPSTPTLHTVNTTTTSNSCGQILHMHTSARNDKNVDLLFQKVAEEVLFVREQERTMWMNHGIKYKHYSNVPLGAAVVGSTSISTSIIGPAGDGNDTGDYVLLQQQQEQQRNDGTLYHHTRGETHTNTTNTPKSSSDEMKHQHQHQHQHHEQSAIPQSSTTPNVDHQDNNEHNTSTSRNIKNLTIDTTTNNIHSKSYDYDHNNNNNYYHNQTKEDVQSMQNAETITRSDSTTYANNSGGFCHCGSTNTLRDVNDDDISSCILS